MSFVTIHPSGSTAHGSTASEMPFSGPETPLPGPMSSESTKSPPSSAAAQKGAISEEEALKGASHTKMNIFQISDGAKGIGGTGISGGSSVTLGGMVQAKIVVDLMDSLLPALLVLLFHRLKIVVKKSDFSLTVGEKNTLVPIVEQCLNSINLNFDNPWTALIITALIIYGGKGLERGGISFLDAQADKSRPADPVSKSNLRVVRTEAKNEDQVDQVVAAPGPSTWTEADVKAVMKKRRQNRDLAVQWLEKNWVKKK